MKKFTLLTLCIVIATAINAQWKRTNVSINYNVTIESLCKHNDKIYAALFDSGLVMLNETTNKWETVQNSLPPSSNSAHITNLASSGKYLYAYVNDQYYASTTIYKSADNGVTFTKDTTGHPLYTTPKSIAGHPFDVRNVFVLNGKIINVINGGFYSKYPEDTAWIKSTEPKVTYAEQFGEYKNTWYAYSDNAKLHTSNDSGKSWKTPTNRGLPSSFFSKVMNVNSTTGRIYIFGYTKHKLMYSDDEGTSWDTLPFSKYLKKDWKSQKQIVQRIISKGDEIHLMLENDSAKSRPDVLKSTDGGLTFTPDTMGLHKDNFGTDIAKAFIYHKGKLYLAFNYIDIYVQGDGSTSIHETSKSKTIAYPNPFTNNLKIESNFPISSIEVFNLTGKTIQIESLNNTSQTLDLSDLVNGIYFIKITSNNVVQTRKVIKF